MSSIKAGDVVKLLNNDYPDQFLTGGHYPVARFDRDQDVYLKGIDGKEYLFWSGEVELVANDSEMKPIATRSIKAGDRVIALEEDIDITKGAVYEVQNTFSDCIQFYDNNGDYRTRPVENYMLAPEDKIEPKTTQEETMKFKKGDRVRVVNNTYVGLPNGTLGTVYETGTLDVIFDDWFGGHDGEANDDSMNHWYCSPDEIEKVEETISEPSVMDDLGGDFEGDFRVPITDKMWIVAVLDSTGKPRPNNKARVYTSAEQGRRVCREMAERHKGETFVVFEAVGAAAHPRNPVLYADL